MAKDRLKSVKIGGIACCVPEATVETDSFYPQMGKEEVEKFKKTTGIRRRHIGYASPAVTASDLCCAAAEQLLNEKHIERDSIDAVLFVTQSADYATPSTACLLQARLGLSQECLAFDINLGCSGYVVALHTAAAYLQSGYLKRVLLLAGEATSHNARYDEKRMLFGEAGSATLLEYEEDAEDMLFMLRTIGEGFRHIITPYGGFRHGFSSEKLQKNEDGVEFFPVRLDNLEVFDFSTRQVPRLFKDFYEAFELTNENFDLFFLHQANQIILKQICKKMKWKSEICPLSLDEYGNTNSASVPLTICDYFNRLNPEAKKEGVKRAAVCGYGVGLSLAAGSVRIDGADCLPVITTDEAFEDGIE